MKVWVVALLLCAAVCVSAVESFGNGVARVDTLTMLDNDRVDVLKWNALRFGASVVDFREATVNSAVSLQVPGGVEVSGESVTLGGAEQTGPLSLHSATNDVQFLAPTGELSFSSVQRTAVDVSGTEVNIDAFFDVDLRSRSFVTLSGGSLDVQGVVSGVSIVAEQKALAVNAGTEGVGRNSFNGDLLTVSAVAGVTFTAGEDFEAGAGRNLDASGDTVSITTVHEFDVAAPLGDVFLEAGSTLQLFGATGTFRGDSGVLLQSITDDVSLTSTFDSPFQLSAGDAVQVLSINRGLDITAVTGAVQFTSPHKVVTSSAGNLTLSSADISVVSKGEVSVSVLRDVKVTQGDLIDLNIGANLLAQGATVGANVGEFQAIVQRLDLYGRHEFLMRADDDVEVFLSGRFDVKHHTAALFETDDLMSFSSTVGNVRLDAGRDVSLYTKNGNVSVTANSRDVTISGQVRSFVEGGDSLTITNTQGVVFTSGDNFFLGAGNTAAITSLTNDVIMTLRDTAQVKSGSFFGVGRDIVSVRGENGDLQYDQVGGTQFDVQALELIQLDAATVFFGDTDRLSMHGSSALLHSLDSVLFSFDDSVAISSATDLDLTGRSTSVTAGELLSFAANDTLVVEDDRFEVQARTLYRTEGLNVTSEVLTGDLVMEALRGYRSDAGDSQLVNGLSVRFDAKQLLAVNGAVGVQVAADLGIRSVSEHFKVTSGGDFLVQGQTGDVRVDGSRDWHLTVGDGLLLTGATTNVIADVHAHIAALNGATFTGTNIQGTSTNGDDMTFESGGDVELVAGTDLTIDAREAVLQLVESGAVQAGDSILITAASYGSFVAERDFDNFASDQVLFAADDVLVDATTRFELVAGFMNMTTASGDIKIEADGGGSRWSTSRFPDIIPEPYGDLSMEAGNDLLWQAGRNISFTHFDGYFSVFANDTAGVRGGEVTIRSGAGASTTMDGEGIGGVFLGTGNEENALIEGGNYTRITVDQSTLLRSFGRNAVTGNGMLFKAASGGDVCFQSGVSNDQLLVDGFGGVSISATGVGADVVVESFKGTSVVAEGALEVRSDGWSADPLGILGFEFPLGVLFRTNAVNEGNGEGDVVLRSASGVLLHGFEGSTIRSDEGLVEGISTGDVDLRTADYLALLNVHADGDVDMEARGKVFVRAGSSSSDGDLRINSTNSASIDAIGGGISFLQLGSSADAVRNGISVHGEKGDVLLTAVDVLFDASVGNGRVDFTAQTGGMEVNTNAISLHATRAQVLIEGQTSANFTSTLVQFTSSEKLELGSGGLGDLSFTAGLLQINATGDVSLDTIQDIKGEIDNELVLGAGDFLRLAAGGSLSLSGLQTLVTGRNVDLFADSELNFDADTLFQVNATDVLGRLGGDKATTGLSIDVKTEFVTAATGTSTFSGNFTEIKADAVDLFSNGTVLIDAQGTLGRGFALSSETGSVLVTSNSSRFGVDQELIMTASQGAGLFTSDDLNLLAVNDLSLEAPLDMIYFDVADSFQQLHGDAQYLIDAPISINGLTTAKGGFLGHSKIAIEADSARFETSNDITVFSSGDLTVEAQGDASPISFTAGSQFSLISETGTDIDAPAGIVLTTDSFSLWNATDLISFTSGEFTSIIAQLDVELFAGKQILVTSGDDLAFFAQNSLFEATAGRSLVLSSEDSAVFSQVGAAEMLITSNSTQYWDAGKGGVNLFADLGQKIFANDTIDMASLGEAVTITAVGTPILLKSEDSVELVGEGSLSLGSADVSVDAVDNSLTFRAFGAREDSSPRTGIYVEAENELTLESADDITIESDRRLQFDSTTAGIDILTDTTGPDSLVLQSFGENGHIGVIAEAADINLSGENILFASASEQVHKGTVELSNTNPTGAILLHASDNDLMIAHAGGDLLVTADSLVQGTSGDRLFVSADNAVEFVSPSIGIGTVSSPGTLRFLADQADARITFEAGLIEVLPTSLTLAAGDDLEFKSASGFIASASAMTIQAPVVELRALEEDVVVSAGASFALEAPNVEMTSGQLTTMAATTVVMDFTGTDVVARAGRTARLEDFPQLLAAGAVNVRSLGDMYINGDTDITMEALTETAAVRSAQDVRFLDPFSTSGSLSFTATQVVRLIAENNLGAIGGLIETKEFNPIAVELVALNGLALISGGDVHFESSEGAIVFGSESLICYDITGTLGFFGGGGSLITMGSGIARSNNYCGGGPTAFTCPNLSRFVNSLLDALEAYGVAPF